MKYQDAYIVKHPHRAGMMIERLDVNVSNMFSPCVSALCMDTICLNVDISDYRIVYLTI